MPWVFTGEFAELKPEELPTNTIEEIANQWENIILTLKPKIYERLKEVIPDENAYKERIGLVAISEFGNVLNPNYYKTESALLKYKVKIMRGAKAWIQNIDNAFVEGGRFENGVMGNKDKFKENVKYVIRFVGDKNKVWGCVPKVAAAIKGKGVLLNKVKHTEDNIDGSPVLMFKPQYVNRIASAITNLLIEGLVLCRYAAEAGEDVISIVSKYNQIIEPFIKTYDEATGEYKPSPYLNDNIDPANSNISLFYNINTDRLYVRVIQYTK